MNYTTEETGKKLRDLGFEPTDKSWLWTLDEVLDRLPEALEDYRLTVIKYSTKYAVMYIKPIRCGGSCGEGFALVMFETEHKNPAEAAAQLLIQLAESGHIKKEN